MTVKEILEKHGVYTMELELDLLRNLEKNIKEYGLKIVSLQQHILKQEQK